MEKVEMKTNHPVDPVIKVIEVSELDISMRRAFDRR